MNTISTRDRIGSFLNHNKTIIVIELVVILGLALVSTSPTGIIPIVCVIGFSFWVRKVAWRDIGFARPKNLHTIALLGVIYGVGLQILDNYYLGPLIRQLTNTPTDLSLFKSLSGNVTALAAAIAVSWTIAAFGEELIFRGYLMNRIADVAGRNQMGWVIALVGSSLVFGIVHQYQGLSGAIGAFKTGLLFALMYLGAGRNLWLSIFAHGTYDTFGFVLLYLG